MKAIRSPRRIRWWVTCFFACVVGSIATYITAKHFGGGTFAIAALVAFLGLPATLAVVLARFAAAVGIKVAAPRLWLGLVAIAAFAGLVFFHREARAAFSALITAYIAEHNLAAQASASASASASAVRPPPAPLPTPMLPSTEEVGPDASAASVTETDASADPTALFTFGDASYQEPDCSPLTDISAIAQGFKSGSIRPTAEALARARYPMGLAFIQAQDDAALGTWFRGVPDSFEGVASRFEAAVHEGSHIWRAKRFDLQKEVFPVRGDLIVETRRLTSFHRAEILTAHAFESTDSYAKVYLTGTSGAQGFATLLDEYQAYAHSLASRYCTRDLVAAGTRVSARDGILTMMYYVETYLSIARTQHPKDYAAILADPGHRRMILTVWSRAELWLRRSKNERALGINDATIAALVYEPSRLAEIKRVREVP